MNQYTALSQRFCDERMNFLFKQTGLGLLYVAASIILGVGLAALITAVTIILLPHEESFLHQSALNIAHNHHDHSLLNFIIHNRVAFGGALISVGILYFYLIYFQIRNHQRWAWWALFLSGIVGGSSYFSFVSSGYIDLWHGMGTAVIMLSLLLGLAMTYSHTSASALTSIWQRPYRIPRLFFFIWSFAAFLGGAGILLVGVSVVFVPQDLAYMQTTPTQLYQINKYLVSFIAHDRTGFAGALCAIGIALLMTCWHVPSIRERRFLWVVVLVWLLDLITAVGIHLIIGYNSLTHLLPFILKDGIFFVGIVALFWDNGRSPQIPVEKTE